LKRRGPRHWKHWPNERTLEENQIGLLNLEAMHRRMFRASYRRNKRPTDRLWRNGGG